MSAATEADIAIIGGGILGISIAWGLRRLGHDVLVIDEGDMAFRASRGNFGLVWVQGKGYGLPDYARWTRQSASLWPELSHELEADTDIRLQLSQPGGLNFCLSDEEAQETVSRLQRLQQWLGGDYQFDYIEHDALKKRVPEIGPEVVGATYCAEDGHVNPLYLLRALYNSYTARGGRVINDAKVGRIEPREGDFRLLDGIDVRAHKVVLCAGLGNRELAPMVGINAPVEPNRGQVLICERVAPFMKFPSVQIRQVGEGAVQIGDSQENVGFDDRTTPTVITRIAHRAARIYPLLAHLRTIRTWAALRVMSPDGFPIYQQSPTYPGAFVATCHSGITLAAVHALVLAPWIGGQPQPDLVESFSGERFSL